MLATWYPRAFFVYEHRRRPLKVGIAHDLAAATAGAIVASDVKTALGCYTGNAGYLAACREGAARVDLNGEPSGTVTAGEAEHARSRLHKASTRPSPPPSPKRRLGLADLRAAARARKTS